MGLRVTKAGILDTVQDLGRNGYRHLGINPNGAMDRVSLRLINSILNNRDDEAGIELHFPASEFIFESAATFAIGGAEFRAMLNDVPVENWRVCSARKGSTLSFDRRRHGTRAYFSVGGGFEIDSWLSSKSTNLAAETGGFEGRSLQKGDCIVFKNKNGSNSEHRATRLARSFVSKIASPQPIRVLKGAEYVRLTALSEQAFSNQNYKITNDSNRMGYRLEGEQLHLLNNAELVSTGVDFGTVQFLPNGQLVVLMADHQTTGGYPKIAHVIKTDLPRLAQMGAGEEFQFKVVSLAEAEKAYEDFERDLSFLRMGVRFMQ